MFLLLHRRPPRVREPNFLWLLLQERLQLRSFRPEASRVVAAGTASSPSSATRSGSLDSDSAPPAQPAHYAHAVVLALAPRLELPLLPDIVRTLLFRQLKQLERSPQLRPQNHKHY